MRWGRRPGFARMVPHAARRVKPRGRARLDRLPRPGPILGDMTRRLPLVLSALASVGLAGAPAHAQTRAQYESRYGRAIDVQISDLAQSTASYYEQLIRTRGRLGMDAGTSRAYTLQDEFGNTVRIFP